MDSMISQNRGWPRIKSLSATGSHRSGKNDSDIRSPLAYSLQGVRVNNVKFGPNFRLKPSLSRSNFEAEQHI